MKQFKELKEELNRPSEQLIEDVIALIAIRECDSEALYEAFEQDVDLLNEGLGDNIKGIANNVNSLISKGLGKIGAHAHKGTGLIGYLMKAGKSVGKLMLATLKGDWETAKEIANTEVDKGELLDFLLKLDTATMHLVTGPIHSLDAITGWHIGAKLESAMKGKDAIIAKIKGAISTIRSSIGGIVDKARVSLFNRGMDKLEAEIGVVN